MVSNNEAENVGIAHSRNLLSLVSNGSATKNMDIGRRKNCDQPNDDRPNERNIPAKTIFINDTLPLLIFRADRKR